jgi:methylase of polypeptide subunit release factors
MIPDPEAKLRYYEYVNPRQADWPSADFIVGNPPYLGQARQREAFGDGYVDALTVQEMGSREARFDWSLTIKD